MKHSPSKELLQENVCKFSKLSASQRRLLLRRDPKAVFSSFSLGTRQVYDYMVRMSAHHKNIHVSHTHIGQIVRKSRRQVIRIMKTLKEWGLLSWTNPELSWYRNLANEYTLDPIMHDLSFRNRVGKYIWGLRVLPLILLASTMALSKARSGQDVTSLNISRFKKQSVSESVDSLSISNEHQKRESNYRIRYTKVRPGLTRQERRMKHIQSLKGKVQQITSVKLTVLGQIHFTPYEEQVLVWANGKIQSLGSHVKVNNSLAYLKKLCHDRSKELGLPMDYEFVDSFFAENPSLRDLPVYEDDGRIHKSIASTGSDSASELPASLKPDDMGKPKVSARDWGVDVDAQPTYGVNQSRQSSVAETNKGVNRTSPHSMYTPHKGYATNHDTFDRAAEFKGAADHLRAEVAAGKAINKYAQYLLDLDSGERIVQNSKGDPVVPWQAMVSGMTGQSTQQDSTVADILRDYQKPTPRPLPRPAPEKPAQPQLQMAPNIDDDQLYEEIDPVVMY